MRQLDLFAERVRRLARVGDEEIVDGVDLATRLVGAESVTLVDRLTCGARLRWTEDGYLIELQTGLPDMNFACAHEVAHWALRELEHYSGPHEERYANYVGAALLMPRALVRAGVVFYGRRLEAVDPLATAVLVSRTAANLRLGEVMRDQRVVVTRTGNVLRSAEEAFAEPDRDVVTLARDDRSARGIVKAELRGGIDEGRVALRRR